MMLAPRIGPFVGSCIGQMIELLAAGNSLLYYHVSKDERQIELCDNYRRYTERVDIIS